MSVLSAAWLLFLLEPLSSTGLAFPLFALTFGVTVLLGAVSLALALTERRVSRARLLVWSLHPLAAAALLILVLSAQCPANPLPGALTRGSAAPAPRGRARRTPRDGSARDRAG